MQRGVLDGHVAAVQQHPERHPPQVARRRRLRRVQIAVGVQPDDGDPAVPAGQAAGGADVGAAASAQHHRPLGQCVGDRPVCCPDRRSSIVAASPSPVGIPAASASMASPPLPKAQGTRTSRAASRRTSSSSDVGRARSGRAAHASAADAAVSPSRLIQTLGRPRSFAGAMSWNWLWATCTWRSAGAPVRSTNAPPVAVRGLVGTHVLGDDHQSRTARPAGAATRRSGRGRSSTGWPASSHGDKLPAACPAPRGTPASPAATRTSTSARRLPAPSPPRPPAARSPGRAPPGRCSSRSACISGSTSW